MFGGKELFSHVLKQSRNRESRKQKYWRISKLKFQVLGACAIFVPGGRE